MYSFTDQGGESLTLRPEATAGIVRAAISNGMLRGARHKLWCIGPMFRHERPQKGRYRQFYQLDVEAIGFAGPDVDAELIALTARLWRKLGVSRVRLEINSLGTAEARRAYREMLVGVFPPSRGRARCRQPPPARRQSAAHPRQQESRSSPRSSPVRRCSPITSMRPRARTLLSCAPQLDRVGIEYRVNPRLVRGLDYYSRTVFEWLTDALGAQDAVCSGGRYDGLIAQLGGESTPAVGFALGIERVVELLVQAARVPAAKSADVYLVVNGKPGAGCGFRSSPRNCAMRCRTAASN